MRRESYHPARINQRSAIESRWVDSAERKNGQLRCPSCDKLSKPEMLSGGRQPKIEFSALWVNPLFNDTRLLKAKGYVALHPGFDIRITADCAGTFFNLGPGSRFHLHAYHLCQLLARLHQRDTVLSLTPTPILFRRRANHTLVTGLVRVEYPSR